MKRHLRRAWLAYCVAGTALVVASYVALAVRSIW